MIFGIESLERATGWSYGQARNVGRMVMYALGQEKAVDNIVQFQRQRTLLDMESDLVALHAGPDTQQERELAAEVAAVRDFTQQYGPQTNTEMTAVEPTNPAEPAAVEAIERILDEKLPDAQP